MSFKHALLLTSAVTSLAFSAGISAAADKAVIEEKIETVVVTQSRLHDILNRPVPTSVLSADDRNLTNTISARDLVALTPGFIFTNTYGLNVRGVGRLTAQTLLGQENTVTEYVDGFINLVPFNIAEPTLFGGNLVFMRGPQGDLGGRNAIAGSVNLLSRAPAKTFSGEAVAGVTAGGGYSVGVNMSGPINDELGIRVGANWHSQPSLTTNIGTGKGAGFAAQDLYVELQLEWTHGPFHIRSRTTHFDYHNQPGYTAPGAYSTTALFGALDPNPAYHYAVPSPTKPYTINVDVVGFDNLDNNVQQIINADYDFGAVKLYYIGGFQQFKSTGLSDLDGTSRLNYSADVVAPGSFAAGTIVPTSYTANYYNWGYLWTHELRLENQGDGPLHWVLGFYDFNQDSDEKYWEAIPAGTAALASPTIGTPGGTTGPNPHLSTYEQRNTYRIRSEAVFGHVTYDFSPEFSFDGGIRYTWDQKAARTNFRYVFYYPPFFAGDFSPLVHGATPARDESGLSGRAALIWRPDDGVNVYASYSRGYQASAFTLGQGLPPNNISKAEFLDVYELGASKDFPGGARLSGSVFFQNFHNMQIPISTHSVLGGLPVGPVFSQFVNAKLATINGFEAEASWPFAENSLIAANFTYLDGTFDSFCPPVVGSSPPVCGAVDITEPAITQVQENLTGNRVPRAPRAKASIFGYYNISLGDSGALIPGGSISYEDEFYESAFTKPKFLLPSRTTVNAGLTYRTTDDRFEVVGYVSNAFRAIYADSVSVAIIGGAVTQTRVLGADRFYGLTARLRW